MKFNKIIGVSENPETLKIIREAQEKLSNCFTELSLGYDNKSIGTAIGGDPLIFQLVFPFNHYADIMSIQFDELKDKEKNIKERLEKGETLSDKELQPEEIKKYLKKIGKRVLRTAATDGRSYYWSPGFINGISRLGLRILIYHEALHAFYMHVQRRGSRDPRLWNISVDYRVNFTIMEDLRCREIKNYPEVFTKELGEYISLEEYAAFLRDPFNPPPRLAHLNPIISLREMADPAYIDPNINKKPMYYADHKLSDDMKRPENVYDYLLAQIPKCPTCGRLGKYKKPPEYKALQKKIEEQEKKKKAEEKKEQDKKNKKNAINQPKDPASCNEEDKGQPSSGKGDPKDKVGHPQPSNSGEENGSCCGENGDKSCGCPECGGGDDSDSDSTYVDPFGVGDTLDDHIDSDISEEELAKRMTDAVDMAKKMAGKIPGGLEAELGMLSSPVIRWEDIVRQQMTKKRTGAGKTDWTRVKSRPMFAGLYVPRKRDFFLNIAVFFDCSGSMSAEDIAYGLSQLQIIDDRGEMNLIPFDTVPYFDKMIKIKKADRENLIKAKRVGLGGTMVGKCFEYEEYCGKVDMLIFISDGFIGDYELDGIKMPPRDTSILWLVTSHNPSFRPKIGRVLHLRGEKL